MGMIYLETWPCHVLSLLMRIDVFDSYKKRTKIFFSHLCFGLRFVVNKKTNETTVYRTLHRMGFPDSKLVDCTVSEDALRADTL